jgi:hypothetical protein
MRVQPSIASVCVLGAGATEREAAARTLGLTSSDWVLLLAVLVGGLLATWVAMRLVLREAAKFSRRFPREPAAAQDSEDAVAQPLPPAQARMPGGGDGDARG